MGLLKRNRHIGASRRVQRVLIADRLKGWTHVVLMETSRPIL